MPKLTTTALIVGLLLVHFFIRTHDIARMEPYVDEGTHLTRASVVWDFETHPASFSHGKLLVYFWLGLFDGPPATNLSAGRLGIALFSMLTAATLYLLGRWLWQPLTGFIALAVYALLPYAFFFERLALADPFAAGFAALIAWRSMVFVRRPGTRQGLVVGALLGAASMAKLTMALLPVLPVTAALLQHNWRANPGSLVRRWLPGLMVAALVVAVMWLPVLVPAYFAQQAGDPFIIVNDFNIQREDAFAPAGPLAYLLGVLPLLAEFTSGLYLLGAGLALVAGLFWHRRRAVYLTAWLLAVAVPLIFAARVVTARYLMPITAPLTLALAAGITHLWQWRSLALRPALRLGMVALAAIWLVSFALPFMQAAPLDLPFNGNNTFDFQSGFLTADDAVREAAAVLSEIEPRGVVYATKEACHMLLFYSEAFTLRCLDDDPIPSFGETMLAELEAGQPAYLVISWYYGPFHLGIDWLRSEEIPLSTPPRFHSPGYEFRVWRIHRTSASED